MCKRRNKGIYSEYAKAEQRKNAKIYTKKNQNKSKTMAIYIINAIKLQ